MGTCSSPARFPVYPFHQPLPTLPPPVDSLLHFSSVSLSPHLFLLLCSVPSSVAPVIIFYLIITPCRPPSLSVSVCLFWCSSWWRAQHEDGVKWIIISWSVVCTTTGWETASLIALSAVVLACGRCHTVVVMASSILDSLVFSVPSKVSAVETVHNSSTAWICKCTCFEMNWFCLIKCSYKCWCAWATTVAAQHVCHPALMHVYLNWYLCSDMNRGKTN